LAIRLRRQLIAIADPLSEQISSCGDKCAGGTGANDGHG
jgi:hypothetical protein